jgi:chaperonin cofactor prefoldin
MSGSQQQQPSAERKQFMELQQKYIETTQKLKQLHAQFQQKSVDKQRALLTAKELSATTSDDGKSEVNLYKPLGRGFVLRSKPQIEKELAETVKKAEKMMDDCQNQRTFLEGKIEELERNLRELLHGNEGLQRELHEAGLLGGGGMM